MLGLVLITGAQGFVGPHLAELLGGRAVASDADVTDPAALAADVASASPAAVVHLAALSSVAGSWQHESEVWQVNTVGTVNLLGAVRSEQPAARVLLASTGEVYGRAATIPTSEEAPVAPLSPYAASKAAAELAAARARLTDGLDVVVTRAFMHIGPGQTETFAVGSWTRQLARAELDGGGILKVGDLSVERDLTDVRDVCRAYELLLDPAVPPRIYNVASGKRVPMARVVELLVGLTACRVSVEQDPRRRRSADIPVQSGDSTRLRNATGWRPEIPLEQTLADTLDYARAAVAEERSAQA